MESIIKHITIDARLPSSVAIGSLSLAYPDIVFSITAGHWISTSERILYITCSNWKDEYFTYLKNHHEVIQINQIGNIVKLRLKSNFFTSFDQKELTILYPTKLKNGHHRMEFLMDKIQLMSLKKSLPNIKVLKIADSYKPKITLTSRQEDIIWKAYSFGYFNYPRGITLTNLAKLLKISKATLSQTLRVVEHKAISLLLENKQ